MRLTVIGGSGGYPGRGRPCSGYVIEADGFGLLIDPGYGVATALSVDDAPNFDAVLVTHGHPDHCADLNPLLRSRAWADDPLPPLPLHALSGALDAVLALDRPEVLAGSYELHHFEAGNELTIGPFRLETALLPHPRPNVGVRISVGAVSIVYTGDCGPSEELIQLAKDADLLLAEASYAREVPAEILGALSSAIDVGRQAAAANVRMLVLTHLMPKTDDADAIAGAAEHFTGTIAVARPGLVLEVPVTTRGDAEIDSRANGAERRSSPPRRHRAACPIGRLRLRHRSRRIAGPGCDPWANRRAGHPLAGRAARCLGRRRAFPGVRAPTVLDGLRSSPRRRGSTRFE